jgi:hypothetical protein
MNANNEMRCKYADNPLSRAGEMLAEYHQARCICGKPAKHHVYTGITCGNFCESCTKAQSSASGRIQNIHVEVRPITTDGGTVLTAPTILRLSLERREEYTREETEKRFNFAWKAIRELEDYINEHLEADFRVKDQLRIHVEHARNEIHKARGRFDQLKVRHEPQLHQRMKTTGRRY